MNLLTANNITKFYTERKLFDNTSFFLQENEKVGIIGINGTGKSTLLKILAGFEEPDEGEVIRANHVVISYLPQNPEFEPQKTVLEGVIKNNKKNEAKWELEVKAKTMMTRLGITEFEQKIGELSGGQRKRLALVSVLLSKSDILILDEPTNHLDSDMAGWLEEQLKNYKGSIIMVTHDRYFLDSISNRIVEIDKGQIYSYRANYSGFLQLKAEREDMLAAGERKRQSILRKEIEWIQRGARARSTKQKAHIQRYEQLRDKDTPEIDKNVEMSSISTRLGKTTIEIDSISKAYNDKILIKNFSYIFLKNDRIGFIGKNGCGKTTLMKMLDGRIAPDSGSITVGQTVKIGYYTQEIERDKSAGIAYMNPSDKVIDYIRNTAEFVRTAQGLVSASVMLERFLFPPQQQYSPIEKLSGGEKRRLNLLRVLMEAPNVLILDEPTNDLDIKTLTILEDYIDSYEGIVITVSHDRYFLDRIVKRIFAFENDGRLIQHEGGYTDYETRIKVQNLQNKEKTVENKTNKKNNNSDLFTDNNNRAKNYVNQHTEKVKFTFKEQMEYDVIEAEIEKLEENIQKYEEEMMSSVSDFVKLNELTSMKEEAEKVLEAKMERWEFLEEKSAEIEAANNNKII